MCVPWWSDNYWNGPDIVRNPYHSVSNDWMKHYIGLKWLMSQMHDGQLGQSQLDSVVMSPGLKIPLWSTH